MKNLTFLLLLISTLSVEAQQSRTESLRNFFNSGIAAFNEHELDQFMNQFSEDIQMYSPTGWLRGKEQVRERFQFTFKNFPKVKMEVMDLNVQKLTSQVYIVDFRWRVYPMGEGPAFHGVGTGVYHFKKGAWKEILEHETVTKTDPELMPKYEK